MSSNGSRGRKPNESKRNESKKSGSSGREQQREKVQSVRSKSCNVSKDSHPKRSSSNQRRELAKELIATAQQQLTALSKLRVLKVANAQQRLAKHSSSGSSSSLGDQKPFDILPNKSKFEIPFQQMSDLLKGRSEKEKASSGADELRLSEKQTPTAASRRSHSQGRESKTDKTGHEKRSASTTRKAKPSGFEFERLQESQAKSRPSSKSPANALLQKKAEHLDYLIELSEMLKANHAKIKGKQPSPTQALSSNARARTSSSDRTKSIKKTTQNLLGTLPARRQLDEISGSKEETVVQTMEQEVKSLQKELELVQAERRGLALQKKLLQCMADGGPPPGGTGGGGAMPTPKDKPCKEPDMNQRCLPLQQLYQKPAENLSAVEMQLNSLREQYRKLQEDFNAKVEEVSMVRVEHESAKRDALQLLEKCREAEARVDDLLERLRVIEIEKTRMAGSKDQMTELDQQLTLAKQRYREGQEELDELKTTMQDQMLQLEEYRNKYLSAQQTVEEQRRQIDIMELENNRIGEQVNLEIQRVKTQFQEKLQELTPLPDMLKATQLKLQECDQLRQLAERNVEQLLNQSDDLKEQNKALEKELDELKKNSDNQTAERSNLKSSLSSGEKKIEEIKSENIKLRATVARLEELALNNDRRLDEKTHEVLQLQTQLETLREESARQVSRTKDRCEAVRRTLQGQISQLECQLAQSRAAARTAQKDRDEIRQRMQAQITSLNDNFEQAQLRIRSLQSHVNYLKNSYTNIFAPGITTPLCPKPIDGMTT